MSWKRLGDRHRQDAFFEFLEAAECISGLSLSIAIHRHPEFRITTPEIVQELRGRPWVTANWKDSQFEAAVRIAFFTALLVAGLSRPGQDIYWISDEDNVFANREFHEDMGTLFTKHLNIFSNHAYGEIAIGTTAIDEGDMLEEDLAAIPDLMCGATCEVLTSLKRNLGHIPEVPIPLQSLSVKAFNFLRWYSNSAGRLMHRVCMFECRNDGKLTGGFVDLAGRVR